MSEFFFNNLMLSGTDPMDYGSRFLETIIMSGYEYLFDVPNSAGDFVSTGSAAHDQFTSILDGDPVVKTFDNFTVNAGHTVTTTNRCKGLYLHIRGNLTVNGTLSMTARGAKAAGRNVVIDKSSGLIYYYVDTPQDKWYTQLPERYTTIGKIGGALSGARAKGNPGIYGACAGGGAGYTEYQDSGLGGAGTSFSGGAGGGARMGRGTGYGENGSSQGGAGGKAVSLQGYTAGGGAGNPGGLGSNGTTVVTSYGGAGAAGTGGLLILFVHGTITIGTNGEISSHGSQGGYGYGGGGGSGAGAIHVFHKSTITNTTKIKALGGAGGVHRAEQGWSGADGLSGGNGTVNIVSL
jgi:hypothetical protein